MLNPACFVHHAKSMLFAGAASPSQFSASTPELDEQTKRYAEVVRSVNKALVGGSSQQLDVTKAFLAACPEVANGKLSKPQSTLMVRTHNLDSLHIDLCWLLNLRHVIHGMQDTHSWSWEAQQYLITHMECLISMATS